MLTITYQDALAALRAAVHERGANYVYRPVDGLDQCVYRTEDNQPSCIVGNALVRLGVPVEDLPSPHGIQKNAKALLGHGPGKLDVPLRGVNATVSAANLFDLVQIEQDGGTTWGKAVELAVLELSRCVNDRD